MLSFVQIYKEVAPLGPCNKSNISILRSYDRSINSQMTVLRRNRHIQNISVLKPCFSVVECAIENNYIPLVRPYDCNADI